MTEFSIFIPFVGFLDSFLGFKNFLLGVVKIVSHIEIYIDLYVCKFFIVLKEYPAFSLIIRNTRRRYS